MPITSVTTDTFLSDTLLFFRDFLDSSLPSNVAVKTYYPRGATTYPLVTITDIGMGPSRWSGWSSEQYILPIRIEIRVWATNPIERDRIAQEAINDLRQNMFGTDSFTAGRIHDLKLLSSTNLSETGLAGIHSKIMTFEVLIITE